MTAFAGGCDFETPPLLVPAGFCRDSQNYEVDVNGGYGRVIGYERYDGRAKPSDAVASLLPITLTGAISVGDTVTGVTSAATGVVIATPDSTHIVLTKITGTFVSGETLNVGGVGQATTTGTVSGATTALLRAQYKNLAADSYRADIAAPTGSGSNLGGVRYNDVLYTFRNNAGATAVDIWKSTVTGYSKVTLYNEISFTLGGAAAPAEGETLTQGGVTATLKRAVATSASSAWGTNTAAGRFIITNPAGGNFAAGAATFSGGATCTLSGGQTSITILPNGSYEFVIDNFGGSINTNRIYGCDGVNRGFEFDGDVYVPITTGMATDTPSKVSAHEKQLFFSFIGSVQHAAPGTPYIWSAVLGAAEIGMGDTVTGFMTQPGSTNVGALAIFTRNRLSILYGTGVANWQLTQYRKEIGAYARSIQDVGYTMFLDDQGVTNLQTSQRFGNFAHTAISARMQRWVNGKRIKITASCVSRDKSQYRIFFSDGYALFITLSGSKVLGMMPIKLAHAATWAWSSEESDGTEVIYFGSTNGMVYQMERGTSFDGDAIDHWLDLARDFSRSPQLIKRYHSAVLEISGTGYAEFSFNYTLGYGSTEVSQPVAQTVTTSFSSGSWDDAGLIWDQVDLVWDGQTLSPSGVDMPGEADNVSISIRGTSDYHESIRFSGVLINQAPRRYMRVGT